MLDSILYYIIRHNKQPTIIPRNFADRKFQNLLNALVPTLGTAFLESNFSFSKQHEAPEREVEKIY